MRTITRLASFIAMLGFTGAGTIPMLAADKPRAPLTLAVVPRLPPTQTHALWGGFIDRLARDTGTVITLRTYANLTDFEQTVHAGVPDLVYLNPYQQVLAHRAQGYLPIVREGIGGLSGALVVARDGPIRELKDLQGATIAFSHPNAFGASLYMRALLTEQYGIRFTANYVTTHNNVYRHVLRGLAAAGGGVNVTLSQESPEVQAGLRVLYETPPVAPHPLSAHPRVSVALRAAILHSVQAMAGDDAGRALLAAVNLREPVAADHARDYGGIERLKLEKYYVSSPGP